VALRRPPAPPGFAPGPAPAAVLVALPGLLRNPLRYLESCVARYGELVGFDLPGARALLVAEPGAVAQVLQRDAAGYGRATMQYRALAQVTGDGLLTTDGAVWHRHRQVVQPAFRPAALAGAAGPATAAARTLLARWGAAPGGVLDVDAAIADVTLAMVGATLFGADLAAGAGVVAAVAAALRAVVVTSRSPWPAGVPTPARRRLRRACQVLDPLCADLVARRRAGAGPAPDGDVLALLLAAGEGLRENEIRDEIVTLVIAGHETVAATLSWALYLLAGAPQLQRALAADPGRLARPVVAEALRLYPPAWIITRTALRDGELAGVAVPAGTLVMISPWLLHRRAASWPDPLQFDPERFTGGAAAARPRGDYLPFGLGPRLCLGRELALLQAETMLTELIRRHRVEPVRPGPVEPEALVTLRPRGGLPLRLVGA